MVNKAIALCTTVDGYIRGPTSGSTDQATWKDRAAEFAALDQGRGWPDADEAAPRGVDGTPLLLVWRVQRVG